MENGLKLEIKGYHLFSKKNHHFPGKNGHILIDKPIKERMQRLENDIVLALHSLCQTKEKGMDLECRKQLLTLLSGLSDDSIKEVPEHWFKTEYVEKTHEGVRIEIKLIDKI